MLVLGLASLLTKKTDSSAGMKPGDKVFSGFNLDEVEKLEIVSTAAKAKTTLLKDGNKWIVENRFKMDSDPSVVRKLFSVINDSVAIHVNKFKEEELKNYLLSEDNTVKLNVYKKGSDKAISFRLGKIHKFKENTGRYIYIEDKKALVLVDTQLSFAAGQPSVWLRKFLPYHEQVAGVALYSGSTILWKTERANNKLGFSLPLPKNNNKAPKEINQLMFYAMQMRFMDLKPATNDFAVDPSLKGMALYFSTFSGRTYKLNFLAKEKNLLRCSVNLITNKAKTSFAKDYGSDELIREELAEWHFTVPYQFYEMLFKL